MKATTSPPAAAGGRRTHTTLAAFIVGLPLAAAVLFGVRYGADASTALQDLGHYVSNPVECVEVVLFCCAISALAAKVLRNRVERRACRADVLPPWDGRPVPAAEAPKLLAAVQQAVPAAAQHLPRPARRRRPRIPLPARRRRRPRRPAAHPGRQRRGEPWRAASP